MIVVFPGLSCAMVLVVASIGSEVLLGTEALQSYVTSILYICPIIILLCVFFRKASTIISL